MPYAITKEMRLRFATIAPYLSQICDSDNEVITSLGLFRFAENGKSKPDYAWALGRLERMLENRKITLGNRVRDLLAVNPIDEAAVFEIRDILRVLPGQAEPLLNERVVANRRQRRQRIRPDNLLPNYLENPAQRHPAPEIPVHGRLAQNNTAQGHLVPENNARGLLVPENLDQGYLQPENLAQRDLVPENPAQGLMVPENPDQGYLQPENLAQGDLVPENPDQGYLQPNHHAQGFLPPENPDQGYLQPNHHAQGFLLPDNPAIPQQQYFLFPEWFWDMYEYDGAQQ